MGIGVADPDAIVIIQTLDENGDVIKTYLRDREKPNVIQVVNGDARYGDSISKSRLEKTVLLK